MERFIELVRKKMVEELTGEEEDEFARLLGARNDLNALFEIAFANEATASAQDILEAEKAYAVHFVKMHLKNQFDLYKAKRYKSKTTKQTKTRNKLV